MNVFVTQGELFPQGIKQAAEKGPSESEIRPWILQGLKPDIDLIGFIGPRPKGYPGQALVTKPWSLAPQ